jgi:hypothetical protein
VQIPEAVRISNAEKLVAYEAELLTISEAVAAFEKMKL